VSNLDTDFDLHAIEEAVLEQLPDGSALSTWSTMSTASTAGCPVSTAGCAATAQCAA
jgi:hypothetical protein